MGELIEAQPLRALSSLIPRQAVTPMDMVSQAVQSGAGIEIIERLMSLQERHEANNARRAFDEAVASAKAKIPPIIKNREGHNSKYADFAAIARVVDPIISEFGLSYRFRTAQNDRIHVTCILSHKQGHSEENTLSGPPDTSGSKNAIQAIGSTLSYLQRYSLTQALGLSASEDDDGKAAAAESPLTDEQLAEIGRMITETRSNVDLFCKAMKVECLSDIPASRYEDAIAKLRAKAAKQGAAS